MGRTSAEDVFARHHRDVYRYLARMTGSTDVADDLSQEVFVRVVRALKNGGPVGHERGWVFSIARNLVTDRYRSEQRVPLAESRHDEPARSETPGLAIDLQRSIARLSADDREIFLLKEVGGLNYEEIAQTCGCTVESVRSRLYRTRMSLRSMLSL